MEQTLGKRIVENRKRLGLTQDQLAEKLGVTAQAVSKWENDQSCPDITMLPKLAEIFGITTDTLLGHEAKEPVHEAEVVEDEADDKSSDIQLNSGDWEFKWDSGRKSSVGMAVVVLLIGGLLIAGNILNWNISFWDILWPCGLLVFGLFGLVPKFSFFRLGCALFGAYFLLERLDLQPFPFQANMIFPIILVLFGLSLLADALRKPKKGRFHITRNGKKVRTSSECVTDGEHFDYTLSFGERHEYICLPRLQSGTATVSFGEAIIDLTGCGEFAPDCSIDATCSFGELHFVVPKHCRVDCASHTSFASVETEGSPDAQARAILHIDGAVSFGEITIEYV